MLHLRGGVSEDGLMPDLGDTGQGGAQSNGEGEVLQGLKKSSPVASARQTQLAEDYLQSMPTGLNDWRHGMAVSKEKAAFNTESTFKSKFSFEERKAMADRIKAGGKGLPVIAERLHDGIRLPNTAKPKFSVPAGLGLERFVEILRQKLPWTDLYSRHSHIRLFVKQGAEMAVASSMGELHLLHKDLDGFLYLTFADSWRPDLGRDRQEVGEVRSREKLGMKNRENGF